MIDWNTLVAGKLVAPRDGQTMHNAWGYKPAVSFSSEMRRVLNLPRRALELDGTERAEAIIDMMMERFARPIIPGRRCRCAEIDPERHAAEGCIERLRLPQAQALREIAICGGLLGPIGVGHGKCKVKSTSYMDYASGRRRFVDEPGAVCVATFDRTLRTAPASAFPSGRKPCVRVTLADGCTDESSNDHPILTQRGWINAGDLRPTDFVAVAVEMPDTSATTASDDEVAFVAYMLSDGGCSGDTMSFTNMTPEVIADWKRLADVLCGGYRTQYEPGARSQAGQYVVRRNNFTAAVRRKWDLHGLAKEKRAHASIWGLPRRQAALFLNRFWACDGHVSKQGVECTLASEKLVDDLRFLCTRLGIRTRKQHKQASYTKDGKRHVFDAWRITAYGAAALKFLDEVGDVLGKEEACATLRARLASTGRSTNHDVVPVGRKELQEICDELGLQGRGGKRTGSRARTEIRDFFKATAGQYVSRERFVEFCRRWNYTGKYAHLATTDVAWERVVSVENIGVHDVYDLTVPGTHNFVANGIVVHNTLIDLLAPLAFRYYDKNINDVVLMVPPGLATQLEGDYAYYGQHFKMPQIVFHGIDYLNTCVKMDTRVPLERGAPTVHVVPYSRISRPEATSWLERELRPQAIIADEAHRLRNVKTATGARAYRYMEEVAPQTKFVGLSGSMTAKKIQDYWHLAKWALRGGSPLPLIEEIVNEWGTALNPSDNPADPGRLMQLCNPGEHLYDGFKRRIAETVGVVTTTAPAVDCALELDEREAPPIPARVKTYLADVRASALRPDGEELLTSLEIAACAMQIACGFYYRWIYPRCEFPRDEELVREWRKTRREFFKEVRAKLKNLDEHMDSPRLVMNAAERFHGLRPKKHGLPVWESKLFPAWHKIRGLVYAETEAVCFDDYLVRDAIDWAMTHRGVVWYAHDAIGERMSKLSGLPKYGGGKKSKEQMLAEDGSRSIICSIKAHGTGTNGLQHRFSEALLLNPMADPNGWEQVLGRLHRPGQNADVVHTYFYRHTPELKAHIRDALAAAYYVESTGFGHQKLIRAWQE